MAMTDTQILFWFIIAAAVAALITIKRPRRKRPVIMMARPMTKYEREHRT
jgi:hypothetical protein